MAGVTIPKELWPEVTEAFGFLEPLTPDERAAYLERQCRREIVPFLQRLLDCSDRAGGFLEQPLFRLLPETVALREPLFSAGDVVADRFVILDLIGRGGMGEVYRASDRVLGEQVALKAMRQDLGSREITGSRFLLEVQLSRRVSHRGVCRVHDVAIHVHSDGSTILVLTMELLGGETLSTRLKRGPLPAADVDSLATLLAESLDAAHAQGIVHGDLKPSNIQLVPDGSGGVRPVLTDFGLATAIGLDEHSARRLGVAGTADYMAPNLLCGGSATRQTDLFAFAVVLHEMATLGRPLRRVAGDGRTAFDISPALPTREYKTFDRALNSPEQDRFKSATRLVRAFTGEDLATARVGRHLKRYGLAWAAVFTVMALLAWPLRLYLRARPTVPPSSLVVVTDVVNKTGSPELNGATEILRSQLRQSTRFELLAPSRVVELVRQMQGDSQLKLDRPTARHVALRSGAPLVIYAEIQAGTSRGYDLDVTMERVGSTPALVRSTWRQSFPSATRDDLFSTFHAAAVWIRQMAGEPAKDLQAQDRPTSDTTTSSWEALRLFDAASVASADGQSDNAVLLLRQALVADPEFAMAKTRLADLLISRRQDREGFAVWREALDLLEKKQLTGREHLRIRGQYLEDTGDLRGAEEAFRTYTVHYPDDPDAAFFLGSVLMDLGRLEESVAWFQKAAGLRPGWFVPLVHLTNVSLELGRRQDAIAQIDVLRTTANQPWTVWLESLSAWTRGDAALATRSFEAIRLVKDRTWQSRAYTIRASWLAEQGQLERARQELNEGIAADAAAGLRDREADKWIHLAEISRQLNRGDDALKFVQKALAIEPTARRFLLGGTVLARSGHLSEGARVLEQLRAEVPLQKNVIRTQRLEAELLLAQGAARSAIPLLERAIGADRFFEDRLALARALLAAGDRARAIEILRDVVAHPARLYAGPEPTFPAPLAEANRLLASATARVTSTSFRNSPQQETIHASSK